MWISKNSIIDAAMADCIFPTDVMLSILTRLPAKSIQRFKFVSKLWSELFSTQEFIKMYKGQFSIDPNNQSLIIFECRRIKYGKRVVNLINTDDESPQKPSLLDLPLSESPRSMMILVGCCNGLICVVEEKLDFIFLWNPAMEMFQRVRLSEDGECYNDDENYFESLGLGYDVRGDDFKLVRIVSEFDYNNCNIVVCFAEVYSVNLDVWTTIDVDLNFGVSKGSCSLVTVNGNPYWLAFTNEEAYYNNEEYVLVCFDVKLLAFKIVPLPPSYVHGRWKYKGFIDWNDTLGYLECAHNKEITESYAKVWVFEDGWRCKDTLGPIKGIVDTFVTCLRNGKILGYQDRKCVLYDCKSNCVEEIMNMEHYYFRICGYTANFEHTLKKSLPQTLDVPLRNS